MSDSMSDAPIRELIASLRQQASDLPPEDMIRTMFVHVMANRMEILANEGDVMRALLEAVLLFHRGGEWSPNDSKTWLRLTGKEGASTKELCDAIRDALA